MTNKPLIALSVVTALALAGGEASAASLPTCPTSPGGGSVQDFTNPIGPFVHGCTLQGLVFTDFAFVAVSSDRVEFTSAGSVGRPVDTVTLVAITNPEGEQVLDPLSLMSYDVSTTGGRFVMASGRTTVMPGKESGTTITMSTGSAPPGLLGSITLHGDDEGVIFTNHPGISPLVTADSRVVSGFGPSSISNTFTRVGAPAAAPEPASLALFGLGLAGLALARRRRS